MLKVLAVKNGELVAIPDGIDTLVIETSKGGIHIDLAEVIPDIVFVRAVDTDGTQSKPGRVRLILSPETGRMSVGVIRT